MTIGASYAVRDLVATRRPRVGLARGVVGFVAGVALVLAWFPPPHAAHKHGAESIVIRLLNAIAAAQATFAADDLDRDGDRDFAASLRDLEAAGALARLHEEESRTGFTLSLEREAVVVDDVGRPIFTLRLARSEDAPCERWSACADPVEVGRTGDRRFHVSQSCRPSYADARRCGPLPLDLYAELPAGWSSVGK